MLRRLEVEGLALLSDVHLVLHPGLNVITGETGAGKSLLMGALACLMGARAGAERVRGESGSARVEAEFELTEPLPIAIAELNGSESRLVVRRVLRRSGRGECTIGGRAVSLQQLGAMVRQLISFNGQHAAHEELSSAGFIDVLDALAEAEGADTDRPGSEKAGMEKAGVEKAGEQGAVAEQAIGSAKKRGTKASKPRATFAETLSAYRAAYAELRQLRADAQRVLAERERAAARKPLLSEWVASFEALDPRPGEVASLEERIALARGARHFIALSRRVQDTLTEREGSVEQELRGLLHALSRGADSKAFAGVTEALHEGIAALSKATEECRRLTERLELDPGELEAMEARLHELLRLARRIGVSSAELCDQRAALVAELEACEQLELDGAALQARLDKATPVALELAERLHASRVRWAAELEQRIIVELRALCIEGARVEVRLERRPTDLDSRGMTAAELLFSANPGEPLGRFDRIASGGERSRVLLALRGAGILSAGKALVFDEIDAGVGGAAAAAVGERLRHIATLRQVLCVTHQASVAAQAHAHFHVAKHVKEGRTETSVSRLRDPERVAELARMLAGDQRPAAARELASALLRSAGARASAVRAA